MRVFLVDGTFEHFRCFHGAPRATDADGHEIGAARAFLWTMTKLLRRDDLTHAAVAFDRMAPPARRDGSSDALLRGQNALIADIVRALGVVLWPMIRLQADDALATGAVRYAGEGHQVVICTRDKDLTQSIRGTSVVLWDRVNDVVTDEAALRERFGVGPEQMPDWHALVGDPSDGLRGLPGWGPKSAAVVLARYGHVEDIPLDAGCWDLEVRGAARLAAVLAERRDEALLARDLGRLRTDVPLPHALDDLQWQGPRPELAPLAARLGAPEVLDKLAGPRGGQAVRR